MKKLFIICAACLLLCSGQVYCQNLKKEKGFEMNLGVSTGFNSHFSFVYYGFADVSMGYRINHHVYVGGGFQLVGFDMLASCYREGYLEENYYYGEGWKWELAPVYSRGSSGFSLPVYVTVRYTVTKTNVSPLLRADIGYQLSNKYFKGLFGDFSVGCDFMNKKRFGIYLLVGCRIEQNTRDIMNWKKQKQSPFVRFPDVKFGFRF